MGSWQAVPSPCFNDARTRWFCWKQTLWGPWQAAACLAGVWGADAHAQHAQLQYYGQLRTDLVLAPTCWHVAAAGVLGVLSSVCCACCVPDTTRGHVECIHGMSMLQHTGFGSFGFASDPGPLPARGLSGLRAHAVQE